MVEIFSFNGNMQPTKKYNIKNLSEKAPPFQFLRIQLTQRCNMRCKMCGQWKIRKIDNKSIIPKSRELTLEQWQDFIKSLPYKKLTVYLWGGEPFLFKGVTKLIRIIKDKGYRCTITTNGYFLEEYAQDIVKSKLDYLEVSVDGNPKLHDEIRGIRGTFEKIEKGLKLIRQIKRNLESPGPLTVICSTISSYNASRIESIFNSAQRLKVCILMLQPFAYVSTEYGLRYQNLMKNSFNCQADSWRGFEASSPVHVPAGLEKSIHSLFQRNWNYFSLFSSDLYKSKIRAYFMDYGNNFGLLCKTPWNTISLLPDGAATFCPDFPDYILGNIKTDSLVKIWNNKRAMIFRGFLLQNKGLPICNRCCDLFKEF